MQNTENNKRTPKTSQELIDQVKDGSLAKLVRGLNEVDEEGLRTFQESIHFCIYAMAVVDQEENFRHEEVKEHIGWLHVLANGLHDMERILTAQNVAI